MCLFNLPLGGEEARLGSIEFLFGRQIAMRRDLFGSDFSAATQATPTGTVQSSATLPDLDLCVMNPPFVRSVGGNLLFGSAPEPERRMMQARLAKALRTRHVLANSTAGLGSVFVAVGDTALKAGGRLALVLPKALLSGVAWGKTRELPRSKYQLEYIVASHDPLQWNFSESTSLSEVLVIAKKNDPASPAPAAPVVAVNLIRNPANTFEALAVESGLKGAAPDVEHGQGSLSARIGSQTYGEAVSIPWSFLKDQPLWILACAFAQSDLIRVAFHLMHGRLWLPGAGAAGAFETCSLESLGRLGPDRRDIHDGFRLSNSATAYPALWGHDTKDVTTIAQQSNRYLSPLGRAKPGRALRQATQLWPLAGRLMIAERMWLYTLRLAAVRLDQPALSNTWWSFSGGNSSAAVRQEKALALWLNSTLGLISLASHRAETRGAWVDFKKPVLQKLPVPKWQGPSLNALAASYDRLCDQGLRALPEMAQDAWRAEIDSAVAAALKLADFSTLRVLLAREPVVCLKRL